MEFSTKAAIATGVVATGAIGTGAAVVSQVGNKHSGAMQQTGDVILGAGALLAGAGATYSAVQYLRHGKAYNAAYAQAKSEPEAGKTFTGTINRTSEIMLGRP